MVHLHLKVFFIHSLKICSIRAFLLSARRTRNLLFLELLEKTLPGLMQGVGLLQVFCRCWLNSSCVSATPLSPLALSQQILPVRQLLQGLQLPHVMGLLLNLLTCDFELEAFPSLFAAVLVAELLRHHSTTHSKFLEFFLGQIVQ